MPSGCRVQYPLSMSGLPGWADSISSLVPTRAQSPLETLLLALSKWGLTPLPPPPPPPPSPSPALKATFSCAGPGDERLPAVLVPPPLLPKSAISLAGSRKATRQPCVLFSFLLQQRLLRDGCAAAASAFSTDLARRVAKLPLSDRIRPLIQLQIGREGSGQSPKARCHDQHQQRFFSTWERSKENVIETLLRAP